MPYNATQQKWLDSIREHIETADAQLAADNLFTGDCRLEGVEPDVVVRLVGLEYLIPEDGGTYRTRFPGAFGA